MVKNLLVAWSTVHNYTAYLDFYSLSPFDLLVRMGDYDTEAHNEPLPHIDRKVKSIVFHPKFKTLTFKSIGYDVALLKLYNPVDFAANLVPICLPQNDNQLVDEIAWTKGFGALYEGKGPLLKGAVHKLCRLGRGGRGVAPKTIY